MHRIRQRAVFNPKTTGAARVIAGHAVDALPHQFSDIKPATHFFHQAGQIVRGLWGSDDQIVNPAGVAGGLQTQLAGRITAQHVALEHSIPQQLAIPGGNAFGVERTAGECTRQVRSLLHLHEGREQPLTGAVKQERGAPVLAGAADRTDKMRKQAARHFGCK